MAVNSLGLRVHPGVFGDTPSTRLSQQNHVGADLQARCASVFSVMKYGSPLPAPNITTHPFQMATARSGIYVSAT